MLATKIHPLALDDAAIQWCGLSGIYRIYAAEDNDRDGYIGRSKQIGKRVYVHECDLRNGCHSSPDFQVAWSKLGPGAFMAEILVECDGPALSMALEQKWLAKFPRAYNAMMAEETRNPGSRPRKSIGSPVSQKAWRRLARCARGVVDAYEPLTFLAMAPLMEALAAAVEQCEESR